MNDDNLKGKWMQMKGEVKKQWGNLTEDEIVKIDGQKDQLIGKIQEKYGKSKEEARKEVNNFLK